MPLEAQASLSMVLRQSALQSIIGKVLTGLKLDWGISWSRSCQVFGAQRHRACTFIMLAFFPQPMAETYIKDTNWVYSDIKRKVEFESLFRLPSQVIYLAHNIFDVLFGTDTMHAYKLLVCKALVLWMLGDAIGEPNTLKWSNQDTRESFMKI